MDFETEAGILQYLQSHDKTRGIVAVKKLSGGNANYVYRGTIAEPSADLFGGRSTVVIKHAAGHSASQRQMALYTDRMVFEQTVLGIVADASDNKNNNSKEDEHIETANVKVPRVLYWDHENNVVIQEDAGMTSTHLKGFISSLAQPPSPRLAKEIGSSLGEFIARLHLYGFRHRSELYPNKMANTEALSLSRLILYDQFPKAASKYMEDQPQFDRDVIDLASKWGGDRLMSEPETLAHGDFWPGNFLVDSATGEGNEITIKSIYIVDWEMSRYGPAAMDLGQFIAEAFSLNKYRHPCEELMTSFLEAYCKIYGDRLTTTDLKTAVIHCGAHLMSWTPYTGWFKEDDDHDAKSKEITLIGAEFVKHAWIEDWAWVRQETAFRVMVDHLKL
ncbi:kinase-like protein [Linnemannia elongata AG-77]|uniref:Kinase-like protein n=1 Tax=Linnemannia elongata AG-77 TaxID=1314771 RepID=A0A197JM77_9FUNG|nr:kinase-like protein [Linnemannia elongata AG-77]